MTLLGRVLAGASAALQRRLLGVSTDEIRYTFEDVRHEIRATRAELLAEIAALRQAVDRLSPRDGDDDGPVAEA